MRAEHKEFIGIYTDAIEPDLCDKLIYEFERHSDLGLTVSGVTGGGESRMLKRSEDFNILAYPSLHQISKEVISQIMDVYDLYQDRYDGVKTYTAPHTITALQIQKYNQELKSAYYAFHNEIHPDYCNRVTTFIVYLNDISEGGETEFLEQKLRVKPEKGKVVIWPAYYTHVHRGNPVLSDENKYIITGWMNFVK
jgi:hypothetical protein